MPLRPVPYLRSRRLYAVMPNSFTVEPMVYGTRTSLRAVWTMTKKNVTTLAAGYLFQTFNDRVPTLDTFMDLVDARYGGSADVIWDGEVLITPQGPMPLARMNEWANELQPMLETVPEVPDSYVGWFSLEHP